MTGAEKVKIMEKVTLDTDTSAIEYLFNPRSIAIIGASADFGKPGGRPLEALLKKGYAGRLFPVNPRYREIAGIKCYPSVTGVPGEVDLAIISVPARQVPDVLSNCAAKKVKAVIVFTSGFAEVGPEGEALQKEITALARKNNIRLCGPNCVGLINLNNSVMASFAPIIDLKPVYPQTLGFVTQSGAFGVGIYTQGLYQGVGFSSFVSAGNEADLELADYLAYLVKDEGTRIIGGYVEGAKNGAKLRKVAEMALAAQKPLLLIKVGRTGAGSRAARSHTGSLAGDDQVYDTFFKQMGIIRIKHLSELTSFVFLHRTGRLPRGRNVGIVAGSGGMGVVLSDECESYGLAVPVFTGKTRARLGQYLPSFGSARNPVDLTAQMLTDPYLAGKCLQAVLDDENVDMALLSIAFFEPNGEVLARNLIDIYKSATKPVILLAGALPDDNYSLEIIRQIKEETGMPVFLDWLPVIPAMANLVLYQERVKLAAAELEEEKPYIPAAGDEAKKMLEEAGELTEYQSKQILQKYAIPVTKEGLATSPEMALELAGRIGYPVALKIQSPQIPHKTEAGGIKLNLSSAAEVRQAYGEILANAQNYLPEARIQGILVQEMAPAGVEVIIGTTTDPVFGPVIMFGLGGIFVEAIKDVSFRIAPLKRREAGEMIKEIKGYRVLQGMRGQPPVDLAALVDVILKVSQLVTDCSRQIKELDINPLIAGPGGVKVADALIVKK